MKVFSANPDVSCKVVEDEQILVHLDTGFFYALQGVGVRVWELLSDGITLESLVETLQSEYEVDRSRLARDVEKLLGELQRHDLVVERP